MNPAQMVEDSLTEGINGPWWFYAIFFVISAIVLYKINQAWKREQEAEDAKWKKWDKHCEREEEARKRYRKD